MAFAHRPFSTMIRLAVGFVLQLALAVVFVISGWSKLQTIEPFAWSFIDVLPVSITSASVIAHLFIGLEWLIGLWLLAHIFLRSITYKATLGLLLLLSIYLAGLILVQGNNGNCGCFGEWLYMKPAAAIWKNVGMMAVVALLWAFYPARPSYSQQSYVALLLATAAFAAPFVAEPVRIYGSSAQIHEPIDLDPLYQFGSPKPVADLKKGKHVLCFFSATCPHCKKGAYLLQVLHRRYPELPLFMALNGTEDLKRSFLEETRSGGVPQTLITNTPAFASMAGPYVPSIYWINNGVIERRSFYTELEPGAIREWLERK